jgi:hypothetical protein
VKEPLDRNKTTLTHTATAVAAAWLDGIGCKPVETEVPCGPGWVADLASFWEPTFTEAKNTKLLRDLVPDEVKKDSAEAYTWMYRRLGGRLTVVVEVKVSRADFLADAGRKYGTFGGKTNRKQSLERPAHLCVLACPKDAMGDDCLELGWSWLELSKECTSVRKFHGAWNHCAISPGQIEDLIAAIAIRRDHNTRYAGMRRFLKHWRAKDGAP